MDKSAMNRVRQGAERLLHRNRRTLRKNGKDYHFTCPDDIMYQGQWLWDSCFHVMALRWFDPDFAKNELRSLVSGQWPDGRIPNMVHLRPFYRRFEHFTGRDTSGITQPPILADAVWGIYEITGDRAFLEEMFQPLCRYHDWLSVDRDPDGDALISVYHPWETGIDNSPRWDTIFGVDPAKFKRWKFNIPKTKLIMLFNFVSGYRSERMRRVSLFDVEAIDMNCYYCRNTATLARIAGELGDGGLREKYELRSEDTAQAINTKMYDPATGAYYCLEGRGERMLKALTPFSLLPLYAGIAAPDRAERLIAHLSDPGTFWTEYPVPTVDIKHPAFDQVQYWRGTVWVNTNWLMVEGLRRYGRQDMARELALRTIAMVDRSGFREYYDPFTSQGHGAGHFGWSSLVIDLIETLDRES
jgi:glycogen debranching enzyme